MDEEDRPKSNPLFAAPSNDELNRLSLHELKERIDFLKGEIERAEALINAKEGAQASAENFFKK